MSRAALSFPLISDLARRVSNASPVSARETSTQARFQDASQLHDRTSNVAIMSSLKAAYQSFLSKPTGAVLNDEASLNYITTLTTINSSAAIVKHFAAFERVLKKKGEKVLDAIESDNALCLEVDTTLEFLTGGGAYLPGLEENFLADRIVTLPIVGEQSIASFRE